MSHRSALSSLGLLALLLLTSCNIPTGPSTPTPDMVATQVATMLAQNDNTALPEPALMTATPEASAGGAAPSSTPIPPTPTQAPSATVASTPTLETADQAGNPQPSVTPTLNPNDPTAGLGQPTWQDSLSSSKNFYKYDNGNTKVTWDNGNLLLTGINADGWRGWSLTHSQQPLNFYLEGVFIPQDCKGEDLYGLIFRATDNSGYFFGATCDGHYEFDAQDVNDNTKKKIIDLTQNAAILSGPNQTNRLGVMVNGNQFTLYANGTKLGETTDDTFKDKGYIGAFIAANQVAGFTVKMDEITLWKLP